MASVTLQSQRQRRLRLRLQHPQPQPAGQAKRGAVAQLDVVRAALSAASRLVPYRSGNAMRGSCLLFFAN